MRVRVAPGASAAAAAGEAVREGAARALTARDGGLYVVDADGRETGEVA
jgi:hypothetical protein